jgi:hypothetical protein
MPLSQPIYYPQPLPAYGYNMGNSGLFTSHIQQPPYSTYGQTGIDLLNSQMAMAQGLEMNRKQDMKPADDDPNRMYWCREPDGTYVQRNRRTIDSGDIGQCRWYVSDGVFYAVRLPSG